MDSADSRVTVQLAANGRILIPKPVRDELGLKAGDTLLLDVENGGMRLETYGARVRRIQRDFRKYAKPGVLASEELIAERREEARRDLEQSEGAEQANPKAGRK